MLEMRVPRSTSSSTKGGKGDQKHGTLEAATGVCSTSSKESGTQPPWGGARFPLAPCGWCSLPPLGGAAVPPWVALLLHSFWVTVLSSLTGSLRRWRRGNASRQTKPQDQYKTVTLGASLTLSLTPPSLSLPPFLRLFLSLCHSLPLSLAPCVSPSPLSLTPFLRLSLSPLSLPSLLSLPL